MAKTMNFLLSIVLIFLPSVVRGSTMLQILAPKQMERLTRPGRFKVLGPQLAQRMGPLPFMCPVALIWVSRIHGGTIDGKGMSLWAFKASGNYCPDGAESLTFTNAKDVVISGLASMNSQLYHIVIDGCTNVLVQGVKVVAPGNSPNTDGIHVQESTGVTITGTGIKTGDDCISVGPGTTNLWIEQIACGPGHGISIGSLGKELEEAGAQNVTVKTVSFTGTENGLRIKSWGRPSTGFNSGVKISQVTYSDIQGTSASQVDLKFDCSATHPCSGIELQDVKLTYQNHQPLASCKNADGTATGLVEPPCCF
ncbi:hypothetical protein AAC387_Pa01g4325 [Persea americana]